jgi:thymidylate synthase (FAD)
MKPLKPVFRSDMTVKLVDFMGSDDAVVKAARVSSGSSGNPEKDAGLINYLMRDRHGTPFEHNGFTFYIEAPIFVFREFQRHRIASYNEESGRYKELKPVFYVPSKERKLLQVGKPGAYTFKDGVKSQMDLTTKLLKQSSSDSYDAYNELLDAGIAKEVSRMALPLNIYSSMYVTMNARALMNFLSLRTTREGTHFPSFPQREIEMVAEKMEELWAEKMPITYETFNRNGRVAP